MIEMKLTTEEATTLKNVLRSYLSDLRMEIADTDSMDFRDKLKRKEVVLKKLIDELPESPS